MLRIPADVAKSLLHDAVNVADGLLGKIDVARIAGKAQREI